MICSLIDPLSFLQFFTLPVLFFKDHFLKPYNHFNPQIIKLKVGIFLSVMSVLFFSIYRRFYLFWYSCPNIILTRKSFTRWFLCVCVGGGILLMMDLMFFITWSTVLFILISIICHSMISFNKLITCFVHLKLIWWQYIVDTSLRKTDTHNILGILCETKHRIKILQDWQSKQ